MKILLKQIFRLKGEGASARHVLSSTLIAPRPITVMSRFHGICFSQWDCLKLELLKPELFGSKR